MRAASAATFVTPYSEWGSNGESSGNRNVLRRQHVVDRSGRGIDELLDAVLLRGVHQSERPAGVHVEVLDTRHPFGDLVHDRGHVDDLPDPLDGVLNLLRVGEVGFDNLDVHAVELLPLRVLGHHETADVTAVLGESRRNVRAESARCAGCQNLVHPYLLRWRGDKASPSLLALGDRRAPPSPQPSLPGRERENFRMPGRGRARRRRRRRRYRLSLGPSGPRRCASS